MSNAEPQAADLKSLKDYGLTFGFGLLWMAIVCLYLVYAGHVTESAFNKVFIAFFAVLGLAALVGCIRAKNFAPLQSAGLVAFIGFFLVDSVWKGKIESWRKPFDAHVGEYVVRIGAATKAAADEAAKAPSDAGADKPTVKPKIIVLRKTSDGKVETEKFAYRALPRELLAIQPDEVHSVVLLHQIGDSHYLTLVDLDTGAVVLKDFNYFNFSRGTIHLVGGKVTSVSGFEGADSWVKVLSDLPAEPKVGPAIRDTDTLPRSSK